jgi:hypothetical protein
LLQAAVGIPAYFLARTKRRYIWFYLLLGFFGMAVAVAATGFVSTTKTGIAETLLQITYFGALGAGIGLVFWLIARPDKSGAIGAQISN